MIFSLNSSNLGPVLKSIIASAPKSTANFAFFISRSISSILLDEPILALILVVNPFPIPQALVSLPIFFGITIVPLATPFNILSASILSNSATSFISGVMFPFLASVICVIKAPLII